MLKIACTITIQSWYVLYVSYYEVKDKAMEAIEKIKV